jgi:cell division protein ZapA (FtsZ GTPase activity inhibitor)
MIAQAHAASKVASRLWELALYEHKADLRGLAIMAAVGDVYCAAKKRLTNKHH